MRERISWQDVQEAYIKYKSFIYYDTSELFQRMKLAEFESSVNSDNKPFGSKNHSDVRDNKKSPMERKFESIANLINSHLTHNTYKDFLDEIDLICLPKNFEKKGEEEGNFITNSRISDTYTIDRITIFADIPVELHLVAILWIMKFGYKLDAKFDSSCLGNRLILNENLRGVVNGSGLFKPYFAQYQKWRDTAVQEAQNKLDAGNKIAFINLDLKDYFYSVQLDFNEVERDVWGKDGYEDTSNVHHILKELYERFTEKLSSKRLINYDINSNGIKKCVLPIGVATSYIFGNYYLREFDKKIRKLIPQVYYGRYVDDILLVIENPDYNIHEYGVSEDKQFSAERDHGLNDTSTVKQNNLTKTDKFILRTLGTIIELDDSHKNPKRFSKIKKDNDARFKIKEIEGASFQSKKTLVYHFDCNESTAVIDKLKQELEARSSEFRDFPDETESDKSFDEQAYYLLFDGTEGKIRTLKDYKENRYGLSVFLANRIFAALRRSKENDSTETKKLLKLFKGMNNLEHFRLWEKLFTYFLVNEDADGFVSFYKHTYSEIMKLRKKGENKIQESEITYSDIANSLFRYFVIAYKMPLALNPGFLKKGSKAYKDILIFENIQNINKRITENTEERDFSCFRKSNLIRHHYLSLPLLNYITEAQSSKINWCSRSVLRSSHFKGGEFNIEKNSVLLSPRMVKFWECCFIVVYNEVLKKSAKPADSCNPRHSYIKLFIDSDLQEGYFLDEAFKLYTQINEIHFPHGRHTKKDFYNRNIKPIRYKDGQNPVDITELQIQINEKFERNPRISIANTEVTIRNLESSIKNKPIFNTNRYNTFAKLLKESRVEGADLFILPECSVPYDFVPSLANYSERNQMAIIAGLEHWNVNDIVYNFIVSIIPVTVDGIKDAVVIYRLKNHYSHAEELMIRGYGYKVPKPEPYKYDLINWRNLYFTSFYCFELADTYHRSIFRSKIDLLIASEWNKDTPYFSNIVEASSRDLHCYIAQVNTSQYGDSRITQPTESARKDLLKLKGGRNNTILVEEMNIKNLREFQLKYFERIKADRDEAFKPLPPDWDRKDVNKRMENKWIFTNEFEVNRTNILDYLEKKKEYFYSTYQIVQIGLFGSYARGTQTEDSDIEILIEFEENTTSIYYKKFAFRQEIETDFNHGVDVCRIKSIKSAFKGQILAEAVLV